MNVTSEDLILGFGWYLVFIFSTTLHEAAHAFVALKLGDPTAYQGGQVTLDPIPHIRREPVGTVVIPILSFLLAGWMIGWASAPYDPVWAYRYPRRAAWMALAGPASNLLLVIVAILLIRLGIAFDIFYAPDAVRLTQVTASTSGGIWKGFATMLSILFTLNLILFVFNLLPLPPLDGSGALPLILKPSLARRYLEFMRQPMFSLLGILLAWKLFPDVFGPLFRFALKILYFNELSL